MTPASSLVDAQCHKGESTRHLQGRLKRIPKESGRIPAPPEQLRVGDESHWPGWTSARAGDHVAKGPMGRRKQRSVSGLSFRGAWALRCDKPDERDNFGKPLTAEKTVRPHAHILAYPEPLDRVGHAMQGAVQLAGDVAGGDEVLLSHAFSIAQDVMGSAEREETACFSANSRAMAGGLWGETGSHGAGRGIGGLNLFDALSVMRKHHYGIGTLAMVLAGQFFHRVVAARHPFRQLVGAPGFATDDLYNTHN